MAQLAVATSTLASRSLAGEQLSDYQHIYLSPHLDDVPLSCGGQVAAQVAAGERVLVVTVCSCTPAPDLPRTPFAAQMEAQWQADGGNDAAAIYAVRHAEEQRALRVLGADHRWLDYLDAIYRRSEYASDAALFGSLVAADYAEVVIPLAHQLGELAAEFPTAAFYCPLALGFHVDHQLAHLAGRSLVGQRRVAFYEDFPYAGVAGAMARRQTTLDLSLQAQLVEIGGSLSRKSDSIAQYTSQLGILFGGEAAMRQAVAAYAGTVAGGSGAAERYWWADHAV